MVTPVSVMGNTTGQYFAEIDGLAPGSYIVTITDTTNGCSVSATAPTTVASVGQISPCGNASYNAQTCLWNKYGRHFLFSLLVDQAALALPQPVQLQDLLKQLRLLWIASSLTALPAGPYALTVTDSLGCTVTLPAPPATSIATVAAATQVVITPVSATAPRFIPGNDGSIVVNGSGGVLWRLYVTATPTFAVGTACPQLTVTACGTATGTISLLGLQAGTYKCDWGR